MAHVTEPLFRADAYLRECLATVVAVNGRGGIIPDKSVFYATGGGQPGDTGCLLTQEGTEIAIATTVFGETKQEMVLVPQEGQQLPSSGEQVTLRIDWQRRHKLMRMHTGLHLLSVLLPYPVTGGSIGAEQSRLDFDIPEATLDKAELTEKLAKLIAADSPVSDRWISEEELDQHPELVKTMSVKPPRGAGQIRLVAIGADGEVDLQPCGGTHVRSTKEIGELHIGKIEKKGKINRRVRVRFGPLPSP